jgi:Protein of unknown function (DUF2635)
LKKEVFMERIFVKPATPDVAVRKPMNGQLAVAGEWVNSDSYWLRRVADGDVVIDANAPAEGSEVKPKTDMPATAPKVQTAKSADISTASAATPAV